MTCRFGVVFEGKRHSHQFGIVPGASEQLDVDRLVMIIESNREDHGGHAVGGAGCVAPAEAGAVSAAIVHADFAQQSGLNVRVEAHVIRAGGAGATAHVSALART